MNRVITGILLAAFGCYIILFSPPAIFRGAALLVGALGYREYGTLAAGHGISYPRVFGFLVGFLLLLAPAPAAMLGLSIVTIAMLSAALRTADLGTVLPGVAAAIMGAVYTFLPWRFAELLRMRSIHWLFFALALNWFGDSAAYYAGRAFGRHRLAPVVSPKKSWEGSVAAVVGSVTFGVLYMGHFEPGLAAWKVALVAIVANVAGQFGDLTESAMKRGAQVKDSGNLLPGHGGVLDRLDSSLFAVPVAYALSLMIY